jgi:hypothetical protein
VGGRRVTGGLPAGRGRGGRGRGCPEAHAALGRACRGCQPLRQPAGHRAHGSRAPTGARSRLDAHRLESDAGQRPGSASATARRRAPRDDAVGYPRDPCSRCTTRTTWHRWTRWS